MKNGPLGDGSGQKLPSHHGVGSAGPRHGAYLLGRSALKWRVPGVTTGSPRRAEARCLLTGKVSFEIAGPRGHHGVTTMGGCTAGTLIGTLGPGVRVKHLTMAGAIIPVGGHRMPFHPGFSPARSGRLAQRGNGGSNPLTHGLSIYRRGCDRPSILGTVGEPPSFS